MSECKTQSRALHRWVGKSARGGSPAHPAVLHMLDVAAVAEALPMPPASSAELRQAFVLLAALHDLGKVGDVFQRMLSDGAIQSERHWEVTEAWLVAFDDILGSRNRRDETDHRGRRRREQLYAAAAGHHGRPPSCDRDDWTGMRRRAGDGACADARTIAAVFSRFWPGASFEGLSLTDAKRWSWWLAGFVATADWIGSNTDWFSGTAPDRSLADYLDGIRSVAAKAVAEAGLDTPPLSTASLFDVEPRPMQAACAEIPLRDGPMIAVIEDETGTGKTEAALVLAQRMLQAGKGRGLYVALPTMATADAMFARLGQAPQAGGTAVARRLFDAPPSLVLAHGRAALSDGFRHVRHNWHVASDEPACSDWLADDRRRALLADVGIGTIDQALMAILPVRYGAMRLYALSSKILIVDEAHEMGDPYMAGQLAALLRAQAALGGSAILLTATLPLSLRKRLVDAFEEGAGRPAACPDDPGYPALTVGGGAHRTSFAQACSTRGSVAVERLSGGEEALTLLDAMARRGAACVWIRNAVDDAVAAVRALRSRGLDAEVLHARFALADRKRHEAAALSRFGKTGHGRDGRILVATQVVEASLDLDFDVMVSDLAPMAALIQRAGRLWRHMDLRPATDRPVPRPVLHVVSPDPSRVETGRWLAQVLDKGAWVYPVDQQWRTARVLFDEGRIEAPGRLRRLVEAVDGAEPPAVPEALRAAENKRIGEARAQANRAGQNVVDFDAGYRMGARDWQDRDFPTRLGEPQRTLVLLRADGAFWAEGESEAASTMLSEVRAAEKRLGQLALPDQGRADIMRRVNDWPDWKRSSLTVCPVAEDGTICDGLCYDAEFGLLFDKSSARL